MPYRGKPSKACLHCRRRKLLCDLKTPSCGQCRRAQLACSGYRDVNALRINDETSSVVTKAGASQQPRLPLSVDLSICQQAKDLFYCNYVIGTMQPLDFLQPFYAGKASDGEHLLRSIDAVSLAYLNFQKRTSCAYREARQHYVTALNLTRSALQCPKSATTDATILSVLLLDLYEKIANKDREDRRAWEAHLQGALALVKLRGEKQYHEPIGQNILVRLTTNITISCISSNRPIPQQVVDLRQSLADKFSHPQSPKWKATSLMLDWVDIHARLEGGHLSTLEAVSAIRNIDSRFFSLSKDVEPSWRYKVTYVKERSKHHYKNYHHVYEMEESARMWNILRLTRILLNELLWSLTRDWSDSSKDTAKDIVQDMATEICASVPQFVHGNTEPTEELLGVDFKASQTDKRMPDLTKQLPSYRLIYPLYVAAQSPLTSADLRCWIIGEMRFMADYHGMENAARLAEVLESGKPWDTWRAYTQLGSYAFVC